MSAGAHDGGSAPPRFHRRLLLAVLLPGLGLLGTRWRPLGVLTLGVFLAGLAGLAWQASTGGWARSALALAVDPAALRALGVVVMVVAVLWVGTIVLTAELSWPRGRRGAPGRVLAAGLACLAVAGPALLVVRYLEVQAGLVSEVVTAHGTGPMRVDAVAAPEADDPWEDVPRVNVLLIGSDAADDRVGVRTDSMMVASIDTRTGDTLLVGIPRNLEDVPFPESNPLHEIWPDGYDCGDECLMNGVWTLATDRADLFPGDPDPGLTTTVGVVSEVTGLDVDRAVVVDLAGFRDLVDAMGGVEVDVTQRVCMGCRDRPGGGIQWVGERDRWIEPGRQRLDGATALWYARSRAGSDDFSRMRRQRCVAGALIEQVDPVALLARYTRVADALRDNVRLVLPPGELAAWVDLVLRVQEGGSIRSLPLTSRVIAPADPDFERIRALVAAALVPPAASPAASSPGASPAAPPTASAAPPTASSPAVPSGTASPSPPADDEAADVSRTC